MKLVVGLGNPGEKYAGNRHNIGFMTVNEIARGYSFAPWKKRFQGLTAEGQIGAEKCILVKPSTYMNESGRAVGEAMRFYKIALGDVIVIHDEIDLPEGKIRVKTGGGNAGHNGLKSISAHIGNDYARVRLGVGHPGDRALVANYVLQDFAKADRAWLDPLIIGVARGMARLVEGSEAAFLSEAARGSTQPAKAAKANGDARNLMPEFVAVAKAPELTGIEAILAAASRPIAAMAPPPAPMPMIAREVTGPAVSVPVAIPQPPSSAPEPQPVPTLEINDEAVVETEETLTPPTPIETPTAEPVMASAAPEIVESKPAEPKQEPVAVVAHEPLTPPAPEAKPKPEPEAPKIPDKSAGVGSWFRARIRGSGG